jgi:DinB superfamily
MRQHASEGLWVTLSQKQRFVFPNHEIKAAHCSHFSRKTLFMLVMKKIARELESVIANFLNSDILVKNWNYKAGPGVWSKKQIIGHLIDSAQINLQRFVRSTYMENFKVTYDQVEWVDAQHYANADIKELLELWRLLNKQIIRVLENYPPERLQVQSDTGSTEVSYHTVECLAQDYVNHLNHHLNSIVLE